MRILYTHRTQGQGAEGAHVLGMFEAFGDLGHVTAMDCLPGCNPAQSGIANVGTVTVTPTIKTGTAVPTATKSAAKAKPSPLQRIYWFIADHAPQVLFEAFELAYNIPLFLRLGWRVFRFKPDVIYERYALNTMAPALVAQLFGCAHVLEVNDSVVIERSRPLVLKGLAAALEGFALRRCRLVITITEKFRSQLAQRFAIAPTKILVLTNGVSKRRFGGPFHREALRQQQGIAERTVLGATGQFLPWHGLLDLVQGMGPEAKPANLHFLFVGDGPIRPELEAAAENLGCRDRLHITGMLPLSEVPHWLSAIDLAIIPNVAAHASPMKLMEYMAMGLPVIAPDLPSIRAAMPSEEFGYFFPAGDFVAMRDVIRQALKHPDQARQKGEAGRAHILAHLTWTAHAQQVLNRLAV